MQFVNPLIRKRDDLPEMTWMLVLLTTFVSVGFAWFGSILAVSPMPGIIAALPFLTFSAAAYSVLILLWRKIAALMIIPCTALCIWLSGCGLFCTVTVSLSLLFLAYLHAVSLLAKESRFIRMVSCSFGTAIVLLLSIAAWTAMHFTSFTEIINIAAAKMDVLIQQVSAVSNMQFAPNAAKNLVYSLIVSFPALLAVTAEILAALSMWLCHKILNITDCCGYFCPAADAGITTPRSFGGISLIILLLTVLTSPYQNPLLYSVLSNTLLVVSLPCAYVGVREFSGRMRQRLDEIAIFRQPDREYRSNSVFPAVLLFLILIFLLGLSTALVLLSVLGALYILRDKKA